jgi:toxin ParE1/3/4
MAKVVLKQKAIEDLNKIWNYTFQKWSENQADYYYDTLKIACTEIGENPALGKEYHEINKNLLGLKCAKHIIFYQIVTKDEIEIIRILHGRMDLKKRINE